MIFSSGRVVVFSDMAEHHEIKLSLSFHPQSAEVHSWYTVGGVRRLQRHVVDHNDIGVAAY